MVSRATCAPAWASPTARNDPLSVVLARSASDEAIQFCQQRMDCFVASLLAMTAITSGTQYEIFVEVRHRRLWRDRIHRSARRRISRLALQKRQAVEMGDGRAKSPEACLGSRPARSFGRDAVSPAPFDHIPSP